VDREERKVVTALFADLVGSTALAERLDPEEVRLVVGEAVARIVASVETFRGTVKDLAGDGVLALFGAPPPMRTTPSGRSGPASGSSLELFHQADRLAVAERAAVIPLAYGRSMAFVKPWVQGWWEFGKSCSSFADLEVDSASPRGH
jgi:class 3 adenylate cyclase